MALRLPEHSHCGFCGDAIPFGQRYCSEECSQKEQERLSKEKRKDLMFYGISALIILALFAVRALTR